MSKQYVNVLTNKTYQQVLSYLKTCEYVSFDLETDSATEKRARVIGVGVTGHVNQGFYVAFWKWDAASQALVRLVSAEDEEKFIWAMSEILIKKKLIMHNGVYDITVMEDYYGVNLLPALYADTILMKHTLDEEGPFGLKEVAVNLQEQLGIPEEEVANQEQIELKESITKAGGKATKTQMDIYKADVEIIGKYCCADVDLTLRLFEYFSKLMEKEGLTDFFYNQEVMPLYKLVTIPMKIQGLKIDLEYFKNLETQINSDIMRLSGEVFDLIREDIQPFIRSYLDDHVKATKTGRFAEELLRYYKIPIPSNKKTGKPTLAKSALQSLAVDYPDNVALTWLLYEPPFEEFEEMQEVEQKDGTKAIMPVKVKRVLEDPNPPTLEDEVVYAVKKAIFVEKNPDKPEVFNLSSNAHLSWLLFEHHGCKAKSHSRETGAAKVDKEALEGFDHLPFVPKLSELKKQEKLLSTYVQPILEKQIDGWLYPSMLQFGTTSGRYSCAGGLNLQTLPRDDKRIKKGFVAPEGYKIVNADFSALEPRIFSWVSGDAGLKAVWLNELDLYSQIAIDVFDLQDVSAKETDKNYLKKVQPDFRQKSKVFTLAVVYGANAWRIAQLMGVPVEDAQQIIDRYLNAYPELQKYMRNQEYEATTKGFVKTKFGRVRHLPKCKELNERFRGLLKSKKLMKEHLGEQLGSEIYYKYRNLLNNSKNFPIQATAAHVCNAAMIKLAKEMKKHNIDGWIALTIHDEITCIVKEDQASIVAEMLKDAMENNEVTRQIDIPIKAEPLIGDNFAEAK